MNAKPITLEMPQALADRINVAQVVQLKATGENTSRASLIRQLIASGLDVFELEHAIKKGKQNAKSTK
jgi:hypothetical protein